MPAARGETDRGDDHKKEGLSITHPCSIPDRKGGPLAPFRAGERASSFLTMRSYFETFCMNFQGRLRMRSGPAARIR